MWVKWTMTLVKLEGPLETDTWLLNESCSGLAWPPSPCTHFSSQILENRQRKTGNSQMQPLALAGKRRIFFFLHFLRDIVFCFFLKDCLNVSKAESHRPFLFCFGKKSPPPPNPLWIRALKGACIEVALSDFLPQGPLEILGDWGLGRWEGEICFQNPNVLTAAPLLLEAPISSLAQREPTQNTQTNKTSSGLVPSRTAEAPL